MLIQVEVNSPPFKLINSTIKENKVINTFLLFEGYERTIKGSIDKTIGNVFSSSGSKLCKVYIVYEQIIEWTGEKMKESFNKIGIVEIEENNLMTVKLNKYGVS